MFSQKRNKMCKTWNERVEVTKIRLLKLLMKNCYKNHFEKFNSDIVRRKQKATSSKNFLTQCWLGFIKEKKMHADVTKISRTCWICCFFERSKFYEPLFFNWRTWKNLQMSRTMFFWYLWITWWVMLENSRFSSEERRVNNGSQTKQSSLF